MNGNEESTYVSDRESAYLVLGCYGRVENGFVLCPSTENRILKLNESLVNFEGVVEYLEAVQLFERPMIDNNALRHLIYNLQDRFDQKVRRLWSERYYNLLERYMVMHRPCGTYARLLILPEEESNGVSDEDARAFVRGTPESKKQPFAPQLQLVRSRR